MLVAAAIAGLLALIALSSKADVKSRAKENLMGKKDSIKSKVTGATDRVSGSTPDGEQVKDNARRAAGEVP